MSMAKIVPLHEPPPSGPDMTFLGLLARGGHGQILATTANALILLDLDPTLSGLFAYDELFCRGVIKRSPPTAHTAIAGRPGPYPRPWDEADIQIVLAYMQRMWACGFKQGVIEGAMLATADAHRFHPIRDWLANLRWDGKPRLDIWLQAVFDAPDTKYTRAVGAKLLIAAVRRVRQPGCKFDHMPIFEGRQGLGKSTVIRCLFGNPWFSDHLPPDIGSRDAALALVGMWCVELPEIDQVIRAEVETVKAFLSRSIDRYRRIGDNRPLENFSSLRQSAKAYSLQNDRTILRISCLPGQSGICSKRFARGTDAIIGGIPSHRNRHAESRAQHVFHQQHCHARWHRPLSSSMGGRSFVSQTACKDRAGSRTGRARAAL